MLKPYYDEGGITIYHADCRDILPDIDADLLLTDPPYGVALDTAYGSNGRSNLAEAHDYPPVYGDHEPFDPHPLLRFPNLVLWGANYYSDRLPICRQPLIWDKRDGTGYNDQADCELAWTRGTRGNVPRIYHHRWMGMVKDSERDERRVHPTQKPVALMRWCLGFFPQARSVIDPYMGSGSTLRAAKDSGLTAIGIEIEERYCEIAAKRMAQEVLAL